MLINLRRSPSPLCNVSSAAELVPLAGETLSDWISINCSEVCRKQEMHGAQIRLNVNMIAY